MSLRDVKIARDETGWQGANNITHRKRAEDFGNLKKVKRVETRRRTRMFDFWGSLRWDEFARHGCRSRYGSDEEASIKRLCLSPYVETFNSKVIKRFRTWTKKSLRVFEFRDSNVRCVYVMYICYQHLMSISPICTWPYSCICLCNKKIKRKEQDEKRKAKEKIIKRVRSNLFGSSFFSRQNGKERPGKIRWQKKNGN